MRKTLIIQSLYININKYYITICIYIYIFVWKLFNVYTMSYWYLGFSTIFLSHILCIWHIIYIYMYYFHMFNITYIYTLFVIRLVYWYYLNFYTTHKAPLFWGTHPSIYLFRYYCYPKDAQYYLWVCLTAMFTNQSSIHSLDKALLLWVSIHGSIYLAPLAGTSTSTSY